MIPCHRVTRADGGLEARLDSPQHGIAPGQACVAYDGDRVLGGGWITATDLTAEAGPALEAATT